MSVVDERGSLRSGSHMKHRPTPDPGSCRQGCIISITSGKGGTGKTISIINLALSLQKTGKRILIIDGDFGMANVNIILGLKVRYHLLDVLNGDLSLEDILLEGPEGLKIIPGGSGIAALQSLSYIQQEYLENQLREIMDKFDIVMLDTGAGINRNVLHLNSLANKRIVVTTPEPHAIADAYGLIKVLVQERGVKDFDLIVNMAKNEPEANSVAERIKKTAESFIAADIRYLGFIPVDEYLGKAVLSRSLGKRDRIRSLSGQAFHQICLKLLDGIGIDSTGASGPQFWKEVFRGDQGSWRDAGAVAGK